MGSPRRRSPSSRSARVGLATLAVVLFAGGLYLGIELAKPPAPPDLKALTGRERTATPTRPPAPPPAESTGPADASPDAVGGEPAAGTPIPGDAIVVQRQPAPGGPPRIALVIDDLGRSVADVDRLVALGVPMTYAVLPFEVHTPQVVAALRSRGLEYLCHLPMEATGGENPGAGALRIGMSTEELRAATRRAVEAVPGAVGANNHMGSAMVADLGAMATVLEELRRNQLYFLDSRTTAETLGYTLARRMGMAAGERQVFLDTQRDEAFVRRQFAALVVEARRRGGAIAIGHPYPETLAVLAREIPAARAQGVEFVTARDLLDR